MPDPDLQKLRDDVDYLKRLMLEQKKLILDLDAKVRQILERKGKQ